MKVLSIRQPWAWLIVNGLKDIENRSWPTKFRGPVLIHASKGMTRAEYSAACNFAFWAFGGCLPDQGQRIPAFHDLDRGGIVGVAEIVDCVTQSSSPWFMGEHGFVLRDARPLPFTPLRGALGFFNAPADYQVITK